MQREEDRKANSVEVRVVSPIVTRGFRKVSDLKALEYPGVTVIRMFGLMVLFGDNGLINGFLLYTGLISQPLPLMYNTFGVAIDAAVESNKVEGQRNRNDELSIVNL